VGRDGPAERGELAVVNRDACGFPFSYCDVEMRFRAAPDLDRPVERRSPAGHEVLAIARPFDRLSLKVQREPRDPQLLPAGGVDERQLLDLRRPPLQAEVVRTAVAKRDIAKAGRRQDRLQLDTHAVDELRDPQRRARRFGALDTEDGALAFLIRKEELHDAARYENSADERDEDEDVL